MHSLPRSWARPLAATLASGLLAGLAAPQGAPMEWEVVGNQGNPADPFTFSAFGSLDYAYSIAKHEVTYGQYAAFLNTKAPFADPFDLFAIEMQTDPRGGIDRTGSGVASDPFVYTPKPNLDNKPVGFVGFFDAVRFANWMHNGMGDGDTETGAYTLNGSNPQDVVREPGALYFVASEDEWYKAAYHGPDVAPDHYWRYPYQDNFLGPSAMATATGDVANPGPKVANHSKGADWGGLDGMSTSVGGPGPEAETYYGASDMGGNAFEWTEGTFVFGGTNRILRGGSWIDVAGVMASDQRLAANPNSEASWWGFRMARAEGNPDQSLTVTGGAPSVGTTITFGVDNPLGTQSAGSSPFLAVSTAPAPETPYGTLLPGFSMLGPGHVGELFLSFAPPNPILVQTGPAWAGPGTPAPISVMIPSDSGLIGQVVHIQGIMVDGTPGASVPLGLTNNEILTLQP